MCEVAGEGKFFVFYLFSGLLSFLAGASSSSRASPIVVESLVSSPPSSAGASDLFLIPSIPVAPSFAEVDRLAAASYWHGEMSSSRSAIIAGQERFRLAQKNYSLALGDVYAPPSASPSQTSSQGRQGKGKAKGKGKARK